MIYSEFNSLANTKKNKDDMSYYKSKYKCKYTMEKCTDMVSKSVNLYIDCSKSEHKRDVVLNKVNYIRISGTVLDGKSNRAKGVYVTLYRYDVVNYKTEYIPIADTISDENGLFQFIITNNLRENFKVKVSENRNLE